MIFNTNSDISQMSGGDSSGSSHLYQYTDFKNAAIINMFIDSDGHLCKRNGIDKVYTYTGTEICNSYHWLHTNSNGSIDDLIYFVEDSSKKGSTEKSYINAIAYNKDSNTYVNAVSNLTLPAPTKNYCFFAEGDNIYAIGNGNIYSYKHGSDTGFQSVDAYMPLLKVHGSNTKYGKDYESFNLLTNKVHVTLDTYNTSSVYWLGEHISSIDKALLNTISISDYSVAIKQYNSSITFQRTFANNNEEPLDVYYTTIDTDDIKPYKTDIMNPKGAVFLNYNISKILCLYTDTHIYLSGYGNCNTEDFDINNLYFPYNKSSIIDISKIGSKILGVAPLNNNRFAVTTIDGKTIIYKLSCSEKTITAQDDPKVLYTLTYEVLNSYSDSELNNAFNKAFDSDDNNIYIYYNKAIRIITVNEDNTISFKKIPFSHMIELLLEEVTAEATAAGYSVSDTQIHYCKAQNYIYLSFPLIKTLDTSNETSISIVYDINHDVFYAYQNHSFDSFVTDDLFVSADKLSFLKINYNVFGIDNNTSYIDGACITEPSQLGTVSTKLFNQIAIRFETLHNSSDSIEAVDIKPQIQLHTDNNYYNIYLYSSSHYYRDGKDAYCPQTCIYRINSPSDNLNISFNDIYATISLPGKIYKLDSVIFDRYPLDELSTECDEIKA